MAGVDAEQLRQQLRTETDPKAIKLFFTQVPHNLLLSASHAFSDTLLLNNFPEVLDRLIVIAAILYRRDDPYR